MRGWLVSRAGLPFMLLAVLSPFAGGLSDRYGPALLTAGPALAGVGFFLLGQPGLTDGPRLLDVLPARHPVARRRHGLTVAH